MTLTVCTFHFHKIFLEINEIQITEFRNLSLTETTQKQSSSLLENVISLEGKSCCLTQISSVVLHSISKLKPTELKKYERFY